MQVTVDIPDQFVRLLVPEDRDASRLLFEEAVAGAYRERRLKRLRSMGFRSSASIERVMLDRYYREKSI